MYRRKMNFDEMRYAANHVVIGGMKALNDAEVANLRISEIALVQVEGTEGASHMVVNFQVRLSDINVSTFWFIDWLYVCQLFEVEKKCIVAIELNNIVLFWKGEIEKKF